MIYLFNVFYKIAKLPLLVLRRIRVASIRKKLREVGEGTAIPSRVYFANLQNISLGNDVSIASGVWLEASTNGCISIGNRCAIASGARFITTTHDCDVLPISSVGVNESIIVGDDVWIGTAALILPGVHVNDGAVVAAGAVVTKDVPANSVVGGVPAKEIRLLNSREERLRKGAAHKSGKEINNI